MGSILVLPALSASSVIFGGGEMAWFAKITVSSALRRFCVSCSLPTVFLLPNTRNRRGAVEFCPVVHCVDIGHRSDPWGYVQWFGINSK